MSDLDGDTEDRLSRDAAQINLQRVPLRIFTIKTGQPMIGIENDSLRIMGTVKCFILYAFTL